MKRELKKSELEFFYKNRKIVYCAVCCGINIYQLEDKFIFQYYPRRSKDSVIEIVCDTLNECCDECMGELYELLKIEKNVETIRDDLFKIENLRKRKEIIYLDDFPRG